MPLEDARHRIDERISLGEQFLEQDISTEGELSAARDRYHTWSDYNEALVERLTDSQDFIYEYRDRIRVASIGPTSLPLRIAELGDDIRSKLRKLGSIRGRLDLLDDGATSRQPSVQDPDPQRVFVVHGRDEDMRMAMFDFLRAIHLSPIEWGNAIRMTGKAAPYVGEVLDVALAQAQAIVVIMTPDDEARIRSSLIRDDDPEYERELTPQARPNVLFESGLALGREPSRTVIVEIGTLRPFSDIAGRHTIRLDNAIDKRQELAQRLETAGCSVDLTGTDWHTAGDFEAGQSPDMAEEDLSTPTVSDVFVEIDETEVEILKLIADLDTRGGTAGDIAAKLDIHPEKAQYHLDRLEHGENVYAAYSWISSPIYSLTAKGRKLLVERGLL
jgi:predicted nucleotide-binding protein